MQMTTKHSLRHVIFGLSLMLLPVILSGCASSCNSWIGVCPTIGDVVNPANWQFGSSEEEKKADKAKDAERERIKKIRPEMEKVVASILSGIDTSEPSGFYRYGKDVFVVSATK